MIYTKLTNKAMKLCYEAHMGQTDKSGLPYVFHPFHVAEQMGDEYTTAAALLHRAAQDACELVALFLRAFHLKGGLLQRMAGDRAV